jgi:hypothetical protein
MGLGGGQDVDSVVRYTWNVTEPLSAGWFYGILILGLTLAGINFLPWVRMRRSTRIWTCVLRLGMTALLLVILQQVELHTELRLAQPQKWVALVDDSASMATEDAAGGLSRYAAALADLEAIHDGAGDDVELEVKPFNGEVLGEEPGRGPTLMQEPIQKFGLTTAGVDRLILLTDGRDTERRDFARLGGDLNARGVRLDVALYGSEVEPEDSAIFGEPEREVIRLGEELVVRGSILDERQEGTHTVVLKENGQRVKQVQVPAHRKGRFHIHHTPEKKGRYTYTLELPTSDSLAMNNEYSFRVAVVEERIDVLLIEGHPRFEFKLMKVALEVDPLIRLTAISHIPGGGVYVQGKPQHANPEQGLITSQSELFKYDVVIMRDVSRQYFRAGGDVSESRLRNIVSFVTKRGGGLMLSGGQDVYRAGGYEDSALMEVMPFDLSDHYSKDPQFEGMFYAAIPRTAYVHPILRLLPEKEENRERLNSLRQLDGSNNVGRFKPLATPLMTRHVKLPDASGKPVDREVPIMAYQAVGEGKVVATAVDTLWRWQLQPDFEEPPLQTLLANIVRYIAPPPRREAGSPDVQLCDRSPQVGQQVALYTSLKDKNYDPIRNADLEVRVERPDGSLRRIYPTDLPEQPGYYEYKVDVTMPGEYGVSAEYDGEQYETSFMVEASSNEYANLSADREAMERFTEAAGGRVVESVEEWLPGVDREPASRPAVRDLQVWNSWLALLLFFGLVSADAYVRKRQGLA